MKRESDLKRRLESLSSLLEAITAMKSVSAHHLREARRELEPVRSYKAGVDAAVDQAGVELPPAGTGAAGVVVIGAELGLCGGYNGAVAERAVQARSELGPGPTFCVGRRVASIIRRRGITPEREYSMPTGVKAATPLLLKLTEDVLVAYFGQGLRRVDLVAAGFEGVGEYNPQTSELLPVTPPEHCAAAPGHGYVSAAHVAEVAVRELLYITLYAQVIEAMASEHGARLLATQSAEQWLNDRSERLRRKLAAARREASTQEAIEIAGGARVLRRDRPAT